MEPHDILKRVPKSNCGECGYAACLAFAAHVAKSGEDPHKCPYIDLSGLDISATPHTHLNRLAEERDLELIKHLKGKLSHLDLASLAQPLGADWRAGELLFSYLGQQVRLNNQQLLINGSIPADPRDQILLYNYIHCGGGEAPRPEWVGLESLPNTISKVRTLATYCEEKLAAFFQGRSAPEIFRLCRPLDGQPLSGTTASAALTIPVLPRIPQQLYFWDEEPDDGFAAKVKILFPTNVLDFLDLESLVFTAERMAERIIEPS
ncbi:MAG: Fe-S cluster protein [Desulfobulbaceae bacterium]|nr:MAG: Fe-S cluster protein [Desulfobulbaceae bacterium]